MDLNMVLEYLKSVRPTEVCQAFYVLSSAIILGIDLLPHNLRSALMDYGARQKDPSQREKEKDQNMLAYLMSFAEVPHSWFFHFYILAVACSAFWAVQFFTKGAVMETLVRAQVRDGEEGMDIGQVYVAWVLMVVQGTRRLYESLFVMRKGSSPMSSIHWALGLAYYAVMNVSVWIEGSGAIFQSWGGSNPQIQTSLQAVLGIKLYALGWYQQMICHAHLASLKKYTLPDQGWFKYIVCPHYTSECLIYLGISLASAPSGQILNRTVFLGVLFIIVNLGSTAAGTKQWYAQKFGAEKVSTKWRMIPFIF